IHQFITNLIDEFQPLLRIPLFEVHQCFHQPGMFEILKLMPQLLHFFDCFILSAFHPESQIEIVPQCRIGFDFLGKLMSQRSCDVPLSLMNCEANASLRSSGSLPESPGHEGNSKKKWSDEENPDRLSVPFFNEVICLNHICQNEYSDH